MKKLKEFFKGLFKKKPNLRDKCIAAYGPEFGEIYDSLNRGVSVGGYLETVTILEMIENIRKK